MSPGKEQVFNALYAGNYATAKEISDSIPSALSKDEAELVYALASQYGDVGLFSGYMRVIIDNALDNIGVFDSDIESPSLSLVPD